MLHHTWPQVCSSSNPDRWTQMYPVKCSLWSYKPRMWGMGLALWYALVTQFPCCLSTAEQYKGVWKGDATIKLQVPSHCGPAAGWLGWMPSQVLAIGDSKGPDAVPIVTHHLLNEGQILINPSPALTKLTQSPGFMRKGQSHPIKHTSSVFNVLEPPPPPKLSIQQVSQEPPISDCQLHWLSWDKMLSLRPKAGISSARSKIRKSFSKYFLRITFLRHHTPHILTSTHAFTHSTEVGFGDCTD